MLDIFRKNKKSIYDEPIQKVLDEMKEYGPHSPEYTAAIAHLETLSKLKAEERHSKVSADTMAVVLGNLAGILIVVAYEQNHVMKTRAKDFTLKTK